MKLRSRGIAVAGVLGLMLASGCGGATGTSYDVGRGEGGTGLTTSSSSPAEMGVGDIMPIEFLEDSNVVIDFAGVAADADFILVLGNAGIGGEGTSIQLSTSISTKMQPSLDAVDTARADASADEVMSQWMRSVEYDFAFNAQPPAVSGAKALMMEKSEPALKSMREFRMLNSLSSSASYVTAEGVLRCVGDHILYYVDNRVTSEMTQGEIQEACENFDRDLENEMSLYGRLSDLDGNGKMVVFSSMQVNMLGSLGGGIVTGYFYAGDLYPRNGSNPVSNVGEIIYTLVPDPNGIWGVPVNTDFTLNNLIPAVLVHEAQHAISYNQHVFVNNGQPEEPWLNEALSHFTEDIMGLGRENPSRAAMFFGNTAVAGLVTKATPNLIERGASYMFMRFLYEQHPEPNAFLARLMDTNYVGVANLEQAFAGDEGFMTFSQFMARWAVALAMTDRGISSDPRYVYQERTRHPTTGNWMGACLSCQADDGRGTVLNGIKLSPYYGYHTVAMDSSALKFFELTTVPDEIIVQGNGSSGDFGVLVRTQ